MLQENGQHIPTKWGTLSPEVLPVPQVGTAVWATSSWCEPHSSVHGTASSIRFTFALLSIFSIIPSLPRTRPLNMFIVRSFIYTTSINTPPDPPKAMSIPDVILNMSNLSFITTSTLCLNSMELPPQAPTSPLDLCFQIKRGIGHN